MHTWIEQATAKVAALNKELAELRTQYASARKSSHAAFELLRVYTNKAIESAAKAASAAAQSMIAAKQVANATNNPKRLELLRFVAEAEVAATTAAKFAAETAKLVHEVLLTARAVTANENDVAKVQESITAVLTVIRSAEAATAATKLAQSVTALASSVILTAH